MGRKSHWVSAVVEYDRQQKYIKWQQFLARMQAYDWEGDTDVEDDDVAKECDDEKSTSSSGGEVEGATSSNLVSKTAPPPLWPCSCKYEPC